MLQNAYNHGVTDHIRDQRWRTSGIITCPLGCEKSVCPLENAQACAGVACFAVPAC